MTWPGWSHLLITCTHGYGVERIAMAATMTLSVRVGGVVDKIDVDTMTLVAGNTFLPWNTFKRIKTPEGEALKCNEMLLVLAKEDLDRLLKAVAETCSSGDPFLDSLICHIEGQLRTPHADVEGVFRVNGEAEQVKLIQRLGKVPKAASVHDVASAFKQRLRELAVLEVGVQRTVLDGSKVQPTGSAWTALKRLCRMVSQHPNTRMTIDALAVCLAPALVTISTDDMAGLKALPCLISELLK